MLLARLARRADISSGDPSVSELARLCGHLPLAIGMLAAQLRHHPAWTPAGLASDLVQSADRLAAMRAEDVSIAAMFDLSYAELTPAQGRLFRRLGLVPGPDIDTYAAAALDGTSREQVRLELDALYGHHLLSGPPRASINCMTCCANTHAQKQQPGTVTMPEPQSADCWTTTCTPPRSPPGSPPSIRPPSPPYPACHPLFRRWPAGRRPMPG